MKRILHIFNLLCVFTIIATTAIASDSEGLITPPNGEEWKSLFNGENLDGWHTRGEPNESHLMSWAAINGVLVNIPPTEEGKHGIDLISDKELGSHELYIEYMIPNGSNSGVYLIGQYEIQVFDSYGKKTPTAQDCGSIYGKVAPSTNVSKPAGYWQSFHAIFHQAKVNDGVVAQKPTITVFHNGEKIIDKAEITGVTGSALKNEVVETGPTYLQGDHGLVLYRNIYYKELD